MEAAMEKPYKVNVWITIYTKDLCDACDRTKDNINRVVYDMVTKDNSLIISVEERGYYHTVTKFDIYPHVEVGTNNAKLMHRGFASKTRIQEMLTNVIDIEIKSLKEGNNANFK